MNTHKRLIVLILIIFTLQGCSLQFWYNRLAWLSTWYADDYVELTSTQEDRIESLVEKHAAWHRQTQLPRYNQFLDGVIDDLKHKKIADNYDAYGETLKSFYHTILNQVIDDTLSELSQLSDEQVEEFMGNINEAAEERAEEYLERTPEERLEDNTDSIIDSYEEWIGSLSEEQEMLLTEHMKTLKPTGELSFEYRKRWRKAFALALAERKTESGQEALRSLIEEPQQLRSKALTSNINTNDELDKQLQIKLFETASDKQIEHFIDYLNDYREDFNELIEDGS